jgi:hypothetical protein
MTNKKFIHTGPLLSRRGSLAEYLLPTQSGRRIGPGSGLSS